MAMLVPACLHAFCLFPVLPSSRVPAVNSSIASKNPRRHVSQGIYRRDAAAMQCACVFCFLPTGKCSFSCRARPYTTSRPHVCMSPFCPPVCHAMPCHVCHACLPASHVFCPVPCQTVCCLSRLMPCLLRHAMQNANALRVSTTSSLTNTQSIAGVNRHAKQELI